MRLINFCQNMLQLVYGDSKDPKEEAFASVFTTWPRQDKSNYEVYQSSWTMQN